MGHALRLTAVQLVTLLILSASIGACATLVAGRSAPAWAEAASIEPAAQEPGTTTAKDGEKKKGRPVVHFEIGCRDNAKTRDFYAKLFDWQIKGDATASTIQTGGGKGIDGHITTLGHEPEHYVTFYVEVEDIQSCLDKVVGMGGKKIVGPVKIPTGHFAWFADPDGNIVGLLQPKKP
jgi:predicted enzyme related to lactoylglutathione lyase